jgi:hypothetical protein
MPNKLQLQDVKWLIDETDHISDTRNNAIHSPFAFVIDELGSAVNPRASKLKDKDLLAEFSWHGATADSLSSFVDEVYRSLRDRKRPWPERPLLPNKVQFQKRKQKGRDEAS